MKSNLQVIDVVPCLKHIIFFFPQESSHFISYLFYVWLYRLGHFFLKTPRHGAQTTLYCCLEEDIANETGLYYSDVGRKESSKDSKIDKDGKTLWELSEKMTGTKGLAV